MLHFNSCMKCGEQTGNGNYCQECAPAQEDRGMGKVCEKHQIRSLHGEPCGSCTAELRERWDRAYYAALTGQCYGRPNAESIVAAAEEIANETIRRHAEMMAERDRVIAEVVG